MIDRGLEDRLDELVERVMAYASAHTGFSTQALRREAIHRAVQAELPRAGGFEALLRELSPGAPALDALLRRAVLVGETYFFRQREHFDLLAEVAVPALLRAGQRRLRAWSAGCSTGEEAYSLAACLLHLGGGAAVEVLGTDIAEHSLRAARAAEYSRWSSRESSPPLYPVCSPAGAERLRVLEPVTQVTSFRHHNLLERAAPVLGEFQIIFCRNVLAYFSAPAARIAVGHLAEALAPGGYLAFGVMDLERPPDGVDPVGPAGGQVFRKRAAAVPAVAATPAPALPSPPPSGAPAAQEDPGPGPLVEAHLRALHDIERGARAEAEQELTELRRRAPGYLPGLLELSLLQLRNGRPGPAEELMQEILLRAAGLSEDHVCPGPEPLPVSFYRTAAHAFLDGRRGRP